MTVTIIAAVARNDVIGVDGDLPWRLPGDQARLKATTMGHVLVMGRRTYDSIGRPLPGRTTIVVTRQKNWQPSGGLHDGLLVATDVAMALTWAAEIDPEVFVLGGGEIYAEALASTDVLLMTWVDAEPDGDTFFPPVDWTQWREASTEPHDGWELATYERVDKKIEISVTLSSRTPIDL